MHRLTILFFIIMTTSCTTHEPSEGLVIAHRGVPHFAPEETMPAFLLARELGADYLEADLQRTSDGVIIALHDNNLRRTTNIAEVYPDRANDPVSSFTWEELQELDAGTWFNQEYPEQARSSYRGLKIISLNELIEIASSGQKEIGLYLETKIPQQFPGIEAELRIFLEKHGWYNKILENGSPAVILQSFVPQSIKLLRQEFPDTPITYLLWVGEGCLAEFNQSHLDQCLDFAEEMGVNLIGPSFSGDRTGYFNQLEPWFLETVRGRNMSIHAYTFVTESDITNYGPLVEGQFTNRADLSLDYFGREHLMVEEILENLGY